MNQRLETSYIIISPAKNEEDYIESTLNSVVRQTLLPLRWIIVDDASTDATPDIVLRFTSIYPWITALRLDGSSKRHGGAPVMRAFSAGWNLVRDTRYDFIVKLDCDLKLPPHYFESVISRFHRDTTLGIASGVYLEKHSDKWVPIVMPEYHAAGASKIVRARCFADIGGFVGSRGWDTVDEIRARGVGWSTRHFKDIHFQHLKPEGSGSGYLHAGLMRGDIDYLTGAGSIFTVIKAFHRAIVGKPPVLEALALLMGYFRTMCFERQRLVTESEARQYQSLLNNRIFTKLRVIAKHMGNKLLGID